jgi:hypothetical protein
MSQTLYIFIDESGNFDFSPNGTKHFVLTSVATVCPSEKREPFIDLKYQLLKNKDSGVADFFHATEDRQMVRDRVFDQILKTENFDVDAIVVQKNKAHPTLLQKTEVVRAKDGKTFQKTVKTEEVFYHHVSDALLKHTFKNYAQTDGIDKVVVILGSLFTKAKQEYVLKSLKQYLKENFGKPFFIYFHPVQSDLNCQIADYCGWAIFVSRERGETRPLELIRNKVKSMVDIFQADEKYYEYKK